MQIQNLKTKKTGPRIQEMVLLIIPDQFWINSRPESPPIPQQHHPGPPLPNFRAQNLSFSNYN